MTKIRRFADLSGPQVRDLLTERSILVQPMGAIEQHGPHLPLSTDSVVATAFAMALAGAITVTLVTRFAGRPVRGSRMCE